MIELFHTHISEESVALATEVLRSGFLNQGPKVQQFEGLLSSAWGLVNPLTVNSGSSALDIALILAGVKPGDEVITCAQTFVATGLAILMVGAKPVFIDVDENGNMKADAIKAAITEKTKAIIPIHWGGVPCDIVAINKIAHDHNLVVIEDAAHAFGATHNNIPIGSISDFTCFSWQSIKPVTTGDGGCIAIKDAANFAAGNKFRWFGIDKSQMKRTELGDRDCDIETVGFKYHMNDIAAAIGIGNLKDFGWRLNKRRIIAEKYLTGLCDIAGVKLPKVIDSLPSWYLFTIKVDKRLDLIKKLRSHDIISSVVDRRIDRYSVFGGQTPNLPGQESFDECQMSIPCHEGMTYEDVNRVIKVIKDGW